MKNCNIKEQNNALRELLKEALLEIEILKNKINIENRIDNMVDTFLKKEIKYSDYVAVPIDSNIKYTDYIKDNGVDDSLKYNDYLD